MIPLLLLQEKIKSFNCILKGKFLIGTRKSNLYSLIVAFKIIFLTKHFYIYVYITLKFDMKIKKCKCFQEINV